ncbi:unnamed protein product [Amoebophrya sp. A120]|nr:unnamed protein product [Amoebophrya sp. A120]|eukprot:GSA120T00000077001.1
MKLPRSRGRTTTAPADAHASSYRADLPADAVFDVEESRTAPINPAAEPASGRAALEVLGGAVSKGLNSPRRTAVDEEGEDETLEERGDEADADQVVASEQPEHQQQEAKPELDLQERPLLDESADHIVGKNNQHHHPNLRGGRKPTSGSSLAPTTTRAATSSSMVALQEVEALQQIDEESSSFLNSAASSASSAEGETKSEDLLRSSDFVQKTAGSVVKTTLSSGETKTMKAKAKQLHQEKQQQRTTVKVGDLLGCACSAGEPAFPLSEAFLHKYPAARLEGTSLQAAGLLPRIWAALLRPVERSSHMFRDPR